MGMGKGATAKPAKPHSPDMDANGTSGYWCHTKPLPEEGRHSCKASCLASYLQDGGQVVVVLGQPTVIWVINLCCKYGEVIWLSVPTGQADQESYPTQPGYFSVHVPQYCLSLERSRFLLALISEDPPSLGYSCPPPSPQQM